MLARARTCTCGRVSDTSSYTCGREPWLRCAPTRAGAYFCRTFRGLPGETGPHSRCLRALLCEHVGERMRTLGIYEGERSAGVWRIETEAATSRTESENTVSESRTQRLRAAAGGVRSSRRAYRRGRLYCYAYVVAQNAQIGHVM